MATEQIRSAGHEQGSVRLSAASRDPRAARSRVAVLRAAVEELGAVGFGAFSMESVAARAGVAKSTVYRHWPNSLAVITDALETFHQALVPPPTGSPRAHVELLIEHVAEILVDSQFAACIPALIEGAHRDEAVAEFHLRYGAERRAELAAAVRAAITAGEVAASVDVDLAVILLLGALFYRRLMTEQPFDPAHARDLVDAVLGPLPALAVPQSPPELRRQSPAPRPDE
jgi:AcrR family transcriptional regulator